MKIDPWAKFEKLKFENCNSNTFVHLPIFNAVGTLFLSKTIMSTCHGFRTVTACKNCLYLRSEELLSSCMSVIRHIVLHVLWRRASVLVVSNLTFSLLMSLLGSAIAFRSTSRTCLAGILLLARHFSEINFSFFLDAGREERSTES